MGGIAALAGAIGINTTIAHVELSANALCGVWDDAEGGKHGEVGSFTDVGVKHLVNALKQSTSLTSLALHRNKIGQSPETCGQLVEANKMRAKRLTYFSYL